MKVKPLLRAIPLLLFPLTLHAAPAMKPLLKTSTSWDGAALHYPEGTPEITAGEIIIQPGEKMPFHCHPVPSLAYIASGTLIVETSTGEERTFQAGEALAEVVNRLHRGVNPSTQEPAKIIIFYVGAEDIPTTHMADGHKKDKCVP